MPGLLDCSEQDQYSPLSSGTDGSRERDTHGYSCAAALPVETGSQAKWGANNLGFGGGLPESVMLMLNPGGGVNTS